MGAAATQKFIKPYQFLTKTPAWAVATADFNRDGNPDVAVGNNYGSTSIVILLGNGDGTFHRGQRIQGSNQTSNGVVAADWNGDDVPDLASADENASAVRIYLGVGDGSFTTGAVYSYPTFTPPAAVAAGDLNGDGVADIITPAFTGGVILQLGRSDGTFGNPMAPEIFLYADVRAP